MGKQITNNISTLRSVPSGTECYQNLEKTERNAPGATREGGVPGNE